MTEPIEKPIDAAQAAEMLGVKQPRTVIKLAKQGKIPAFRGGDLWKFYRSDIQASIDEQRKRQVAGKTEEEDDSSPLLRGEGRQLLWTISMIAIACICLSLL
jgi:excisionase family DNA binding protein